MTRRIPKYSALAVVAIASTLRIATASAGPCAAEITEFRAALPQNKNGEPTFIASAPQSIAAQLEHQPTKDSVERAKKQAQAQILAVLAQAEALDSEGNSGECRASISKAKLLLNP
jgi:hypothetical protein